RQADQQAGRSGRAAEAAPVPRDVAQHERNSLLRRELNGLVGAWHHRTGKPHGAIHAELRTSCGGPPAALASADEIQERIDTIRAWAAARS
ncbi:MAG: ATP-dependent helicase, partial [Acidimicrobiales bacterium]